MLTTLPQKAEPAHTALILVDGAVNAVNDVTFLIRGRIPETDRADSGGVCIIGPLHIDILQSSIAARYYDGE